MLSRRRSAGFLLGLVALAGGLACFTPPASAADATYTALRSTRPDGRRTVLAAPFQFERDAFRFELTSGTLHWLAPVGDRTVGAIFLGQGKVRLHPATEDERKHLAFLRGEANLEVLEDSFTRLVLFFADHTADELVAAGAAQTGAADAAAVKATEDFFRWQKKEFRSNLQLRLLSDLLDTPGIRSGVFLALFEGTDLGLSIAAVDPQGADGLGIADGGEDTVLYVNSQTKGGVYYLSHQQSEVDAGRRGSYKPRVEASHYAITTTIDRGTDLAGETTMDLEVKLPLRVIRLGLMSNLRIREAAWRKKGADAWNSLEVIQEPDSDYDDFLPEDSEAALVLPEVVAKSEELQVRVAYAGDKVLFDRGGGNFAVGARTSWYPNVGTFRDLATYDLTFQVPAGNQVIATGQLTSSNTSGGKEVTVWQAPWPIRVAGFNYGKFKKLEKTDEIVNIKVQVFTGTGTPDVIARINQSLRGSGGVGQITALDDDSAFAAEGPSSIGRVNAEKIAESTLADGLNQLRVGTKFFGALPLSHVAITQQEQWNFGQSWPSLIFMPYMAFLTGTQRKDLGMGANANDFVDLVGYHEMAHQWWGHHIGWDSHRDQWLSEGFAEFSAVLTQQLTSGWPEAIKSLKKSRDVVVGKAGSSVPWHEVGPITRGYRLTSFRAPAGQLIYSKGGLVLHMLRMMMMELGAPEPDARFIAMMRDFTTSYASKAPNTEDFKKVVERHMTPVMNAKGDGKMDWFFDQWVYGTEVPKLTSSLKAKKLDGDEYEVTGTITMAEVGPEFRVMVPLYADLNRGGLVPFGFIPLIGPQTREVNVKVKLPERPRKVLVNGRLEVLAKD